MISSVIKQFDIFKIDFEIELSIYLFLSIYIFLNELLVSCITILVLNGNSVSDVNIGNFEL